jgi:hypothetical protein
MEKKNWFIDKRGQTENIVNHTDTNSFASFFSERESRAILISAIVVCDSLRVWGKLIDQRRQRDGRETLASFPTSIAGKNSAAAKNNARR